MPLVNVVNDQNITDALLWLLTFYDPAGGMYLRAVNNLEDVVSRKNTFTAFPFELTLPPDDGQKPQNVQLTFANVSRGLVPLIRQYESGQAPTVLLELVLSSSPDTVEKRLDFLTVASCEFDALAVRFTLANTYIFNRKTMTATYNAEEFPGVYFPLK